MECIEQCAAYKVLRPDHARGLDQKLAADACEAKAGESGSEDEEDLKSGAEIEAVVLLRNDDGIHHVRRGDGDIGHHVDQHMFLDVEGTRVEGELGAAEDPREYPGSDGQDVRKRLAQRVCDKKHDGRHDGRCRVTEVEKRV